MAEKKKEGKSKGAESKEKKAKKIAEPKMEQPSEEMIAEVKKKAEKMVEKAEKAEKGSDSGKSLVDQVREGMAEEKAERPSQSTPQKSEFVAIMHVHASKNNTIVTATDLSGAETLARVSGGMVVKSGREEKSPFAGNQIGRKVADALKERGVTKVDMFIRGKGGHRGQKTPGRAASAVIKIIARSGLRIRRIEDVTPIPHGGSKAPGGKRGRRV